MLDHADVFALVFVLKYSEQHFIDTSKQKREVEGNIHLIKYKTPSSCWTFTEPVKAVVI